MNRAPKTTEAFDALIATLTEIRDGYVLNEDRFTEDIDVVEGYRYVTEVLSGMSEFFVEGDPDHPRMASIVHPARKLQGDNPDAIYHYARISGDRTYRVTEIVGTSKEGLNQAITNGLTRAGETLRHLDWFEVTEIRGHIVDNQIDHYQVGLKVGFRLEDS